MVSYSDYGLKDELKFCYSGQRLTGNLNQEQVKVHYSDASCSELCAIIGF